MNTLSRDETTIMYFLKNLIFLILFTLFSIAAAETKSIDGSAPSPMMFQSSTEASKVLDIRLNPEALPDKLPQQVNFSNQRELPPRNKVYRNFWHPTYQCQRLAYCEGDCCGKPVADHYCQLMGYDHSVENIIAYNVGLTHSLYNRERCTGWRCDGFMEISCVCDNAHKPPKPYHFRERAFPFPRLNEYRVDWCYEEGRGCGARAANAFCMHLGYLKASHFEQECEVAATKAIGNQALCFGPDCNAFKTIVCFR